MRIAFVLFGLLVIVGTQPRLTHGQADTDSTYTVQSGDTLYNIARSAGVSVRTLMQWNDLDDTNLQVGQTLRIRPPSSTVDEGEPPPESADSTAPPDPSPTDSGDASPSDSGATASSQSYGRHSVEPGDTFVSLALRLGTPADSLFALNDSTTAPLPSGRTLRLPSRFAPPTHTVESGDTLYRIAGEYGVSVRALRVENDLDTNTLEPGQRLRIPGRTAGLPPQGEWAAPDSTGRVAVYPAAFAERLTASGTAYDPTDFVVSHPSLPFGSVVLLSTREPANHTFARVIDRGPIEEGVLLDVSKAVVDQLDVDPEASPTVALRVVWIDRATD